jgi:hypothetical protein
LEQFQVGIDASQDEKIPASAGIAALRLCEKKP